MDLEEMGVNAGIRVDSAQDRDYWRALVNAALKPPGSIGHEISLVNYSHSHGNIEGDSIRHWCTYWHIEGNNIANEAICIQSNKI